MNIEEKIVDLWMWVDPISAYTQGVEECAGKVFVHSDENLRYFEKKADEYIGNAEDFVQEKVLRCIKLSTLFWEPQQTVSSALWGIFSYLVKEGARPKSMPQLLGGIAKNVEIDMEMKPEHVPVEIKIIVNNACRGLIDILNAIDATGDKNLERTLENLRSTCTKYMKIYSVKGLKKGGFDEIFPILEAEGERDIGRKNIYPHILVDMFDYPESYTEIEDKSLGWLNEELPHLNKLASEISGMLGCEDRVESVAEGMRKDVVLRGKEILGFVTKMREVIMPFVNEKIVKIWEGYDTRVIETPDYLLNFIPTAAMTPLNMLTDAPFNIFFVTTSERMSPSASPADLILTLVHEEYGHCVNFTNSAVGFAHKPRKIEIIDTNLNRPITEGIAFHREEEFLSKIREAHESGKKNKVLEAIGRVIEVEKFLLYEDFMVSMWKVIRYLRAIGDVRVNMHKQSVAEYVEWASKKTGLSKKIIFDQFFIFVEMPGYAPCYSMGGKSIAEIQNKKVNEGRDLVEFNTFASSRGFPPRTVYERDLMNW